MAKSAYTKFVLRTTKKAGVATLYTRRVGFNSNLMLQYEANPESTLAGYVTKAYTADVGNGRAGRKTDIYQRWQMVSCHTGRRSFATNMRLRGNDRDVICAATGHTTEASLSRYIKEDRLTRASRLM